MNRMESHCFMKISTGIGFLLNPGEGLLSVLSELFLEPLLSRLPTCPTSDSWLRRTTISAPVNFRCFSFFADLEGEGSVGVEGTAFSLLEPFLNENFDIQEEDWDWLL